MKFRHTPGPWNWTYRSNNNGLFPKDFEIYDSDERLGGAWRGIAKLGNHRPPHENRANALLISAAPEMLDALLETLSCIDQHTDDPVIGPIIERAMRAIAKARVES